MDQCSILEDQYRTFAATEYAGDDKLVDLQLKAAHAGPQTDHRLQRIHEAHEAMLLKQAEVQAADEMERVQKVGARMHTRLLAIFTALVQSLHTTTHNARNKSSKRRSVPRQLYS